MGVYRSDFATETQSKFELAWMWMSGCIPVARNAKLRNFDRPHEQPLLVLGQFSQQDLRDRLDLLRQAIKDPAGAAHGLNLDCICDRLRTIMALLPADCAFELMFDQLSKGLRNTANIHFGELHTSELAGGRGYLRTYFPLPVWGKQVLTSESSLMQARMAPLPFLSFDVDDSGPLNPERSIRFRARIRAIPLGDGWTPVSVPANSREAVNRNLQTYYCAQEILLGLEKDALRASNWTGEMQAALVQAAQEAMTKELPDSYNAFSQALADLRVFRHRDIFAAKLKDLYLKLWDAPLMAERWRKLTHDMIQCPDQRALLEQEAGLSNAERDIIADAKLDELALAKREWLSRRLFRIIAIDDHQLTVEIPMLELDQMPVLRRDLVPGVLQPHLRPELLLEAYVNVNAANAGEIRFHDIRLPLDQTVP